MKKILLLIIVQFVCYYSWSQNPNPNAAVSNFIQNEMNSVNNPGTTTVIVKDGQVVWLESFGKADISNNIAVTENTIFMLASVSKLFTGTALMTLADDGVIDLDDPINDYLPFTIQVPGHTNTPITFRMLMTHTASVEDNGAVMDTYYSTGDPTIPLATIMRDYFSTSGDDYNATKNFHSQRPGTFYDYSNIGTALAGYMVEVVAQMPFDQYCKTHIFDPLGMNNASWFLAGLDVNQIAIPYSRQGGQYVADDHYGFADYPNGQLRTNILDLKNFMLAFLQNGSLGNNEILSSTAVNEMLRLQVSNLEPTQGLSWYQEDVFLSSGGSIPLWGHNGGETGVSTDMYINPDNGIGVAVLSNGEGDNLEIVDELYNYALTLEASLPIELIEFSAEKSADKVQLHWQTVNEMNHTRFDIEHSSDGKNWLSIGLVKGNASKQNSYYFTHQKPAIGSNYYRLKQIDADGLIEYSTIRTVQLLGQVTNWSVFPNPSQQRSIQLSVTDENLVMGTLQIFDSLGQVVHSQTITKHKTTVPIVNLPKGIYTMALEKSKEKSWQQFIIQ